MFKNRYIAVRKGIPSVYKGIMNLTSLSTFQGIRFSNNIANRIVTDFIVLHVDIRYNYLPFLATY
jgi:hypothetical protein